MSIAQPRERSPLIRSLGAPVRAKGARDVAGGRAPGASFMRGVVADLGAAALVTTCLAPVGATLLTAVIHVHLGKSLSDFSTDPTPALLGNLLVSWLILALPCALLGLGRAQSVN